MGRNSRLGKFLVRFDETQPPEIALPLVFPPPEEESESEDESYYEPSSYGSPDGSSVALLLRWGSRGGGYGGGVRS